MSDYKKLYRNTKYDDVAPKVDASRDGQLTAFNFPTIHIQNVEKNKETKAKAGVPGKQLRNDLGDILKHNELMENEKLLGRNNFMQRSIILENQQKEKYKNPGRQVVFLGDPKDESNLQANDLNRLSDEMQMIRKMTNEIGPRNCEALAEAQDKRINRAKRILEYGKKDAGVGKMSKLIDEKELKDMIMIKRTYGDEVQ